MDSVRLFTSAESSQICFSETYYELKATFTQISIRKEEMLLKELAQNNTTFFFRIENII